VGNKVVYRDTEFIMGVGGPNSKRLPRRSRRRVLLLEGDMLLRIVEDGKVRDPPIRQDEILLPPNVRTRRSAQPTRSAWSSSVVDAQANSTACSGTASIAISCCTKSSSR
jgi:hypothetical protein